MNNINLVGYLAYDPQSRQSANGNIVVTTTIAVQRNKEETDFIPLLFFNNQADYVLNYCKKGNLVAINGRLQIRQWTDNNGAKKTSAEVVANQVYNLRTKSNEDDEAPKTSNGPLNKGQQQAIYNDNNLPF